MGAERSTFSYLLILLQTDLIIVLRKVESVEGFSVSAVKILIV